METWKALPAGIEIEGKVAVFGISPKVRDAIIRDHKLAVLLDDIVRSGHLPPSSEVYDQYDAIATGSAEEAQG